MRESCTASIRPMAKTHKSHSGSSSRSKGAAHNQSKLQKKKPLGPPPPAQRGGVELVDPLVQAQLKLYDEALSLFHQQKFRSEERRVGKECRTRWRAPLCKKNREKAMLWTRMTSQPQHWSTPALSKSMLSCF